MPYQRFLYWALIAAFFGMWAYFVYRIESPKLTNSIRCRKSWRSTTDTYCGKLYGNVGTAAEGGTGVLAPAEVLPSIPRGLATSDPEPEPEPEPQPHQ